MKQNKNTSNSKEQENVQFTNGPIDNIFIFYILYLLNIKIKLSMRSHAILKKLQNFCDYETNVVLQNLKSNKLFTINVTQLFMI